MSTLTDKLPKIELPTVELPKAVDTKPLYAVAGVVDLTVEQVKDVPADAKKLQATLVAKLEAARTERTATLKSVPAQLKALPTEAKKLQNELLGRALKAQTEATEYYGKLATRGEKLVGQIRRQPATEAAIAEGKAAVKKAESAATSAKKATKSTAKAVEDAAEKLG